jgi:hypothetical protein
LNTIGHNKYKELFSTKLKIKVDKNPTWPRIIDAISALEHGLLAGV